MSLPVPLEFVSAPCCVCGKKEGIEPAAECWQCKRLLCLNHELCACGAGETRPHTCVCETCGEEMSP